MFCVDYAFMLISKRHADYYHSFFLYHDTIVRVIVCKYFDFLNQNCASSSIQSTQTLYTEKSGIVKYLKKTALCTQFFLLDSWCGFSLVHTYKHRYVYAIVGFGSTCAPHATHF